MLQLAKAAGLLPDFSTIDDEDAYEQLTVLADVLRMIRDGDPTSPYPRAEELYAKINVAE